MRNLLNRARLKQAGRQVGLQVSDDAVAAIERHLEEIVNAATRVTLRGGGRRLKGITIWGVIKDDGQ